VGEPTEQLQMLWTKGILPLQRIEPQFSGYPARSLASILTELSRLQQCLHRDPKILVGTRRGKVEHTEELHGGLDMGVLSHPFHTCEECCSGVD
jgi:hypothetical protein